jgi:precorrin-2/cobalt-factor-2 C20-methyltransferase
MARDEGWVVMSVQGTLYGVGVGPGDPQLLTLKACEVIKSVDVLAYPVNGSGTSYARSIASGVIPKGTDELAIHVPMKVERGPAQDAYDAASGTISDHLNAGRNVAYLCVGDPLFYGSFMYLAARLGEKYSLEIVPGVTSLTACAARTHIPLGGRNDVLSVVPATLDEPELKSAILAADMAVIIKVGRHFGKVRDVLRAAGMADRAVILESASGEDERITPLEDLEQDDAPYFSTILVRRGELS